MNLKTLLVSYKIVVSNNEYHILISFTEKYSNYSSPLLVVRQQYIRSSSYSISWWIYHFGTIIIWSWILIFLSCVGSSFSQQLSVRESTTCSLKIYSFYGIYWSSPSLAIQDHVICSILYQSFLLYKMRAWPCLNTKWKKISLSINQQQKKIFRTGLRYAFQKAKTQDTMSGNNKLISIIKHKWRKQHLGFF